ncbi:phage holin family protein [Roseivirga sp. BDSF3-8]|uniref:phage holin family protein n=1 Tax=Roseivirga sp. BDSF3-8 TaxID=3241598 RepID=UPI003531F620
MMDIIITILVNAVVFLLASKVMSSVYLRSFGTAIWVAILFGIIGWLLGWLFTFLVNALTLGIFWITGLSIVIRIIVNAIVIEIVDKLSSGFDTKGFSPNIILAILIAIAGALTDYLLYST